MTTETKERVTPRRGAWYAVAATAVAALVFGAVALLPNSEEPSGPPLALSLGDPNSMASCIAFSVDILADMSMAFKGTAVAVEGDQVTMDVEHWYTGGDADQVVLTAPAGMLALIDAFDIEVGSTYLITAEGGNVNYCGFSGLATPEFEAAFDEAFPAA